MFLSAGRVYAWYLSLCVTCFFRLSERGKRLQITQITEICKTTGANVFLNLTELFCVSGGFSGVLEVILVLETFTNSAPNKVLNFQKTLDHTPVKTYISNVRSSWSKSKMFLKQ